MSAPLYHHCGRAIDAHELRTDRGIVVEYADPCAAAYPAITHCPQCGGSLADALRAGQLYETQPMQEPQ